VSVHDTHEGTVPAWGARGGGIGVHPTGVERMKGRGGGGLAPHASVYDHSLDVGMTLYYWAHCRHCHIGDILSTANYQEGKTR